MRPRHREVRPGATRSSTGAPPPSDIERVVGGSGLKWGVVWVGSGWKELVGAEGSCRKGVCDKRVVSGAIIERLASSFDSLEVEEERSRGFREPEFRPRGYR